MKSLLSFFLLASALFLSSCSGKAQSGNPLQKSTATRIEVLDFHTDHRCPTCLTIEKLTKEVLRKSFAAQMDKGLITFQLINVDKEENLPVARKFGAFGTSLMLNVIENGQEKHVDLTDFAFLNSGDEGKFTQGLRDKINAALKDLQL